MTRLALGAAVAVVSVLAAFTRPFSDGADAVTAGVLVCYLALLVTGSLAQPGSSLRRRLGPQRRARRTAGHPAIGVALWLGVAAALIGFEIVNYFLLPRSAHPTISSLFSLIAAHSWSRGLLFFGWLLLGARIVLA